jgi:hypothetical protein
MVGSLPPEGRVKLVLARMLLAVASAMIGLPAQAQDADPARLPPALFAVDETVQKLRLDVPAASAASPASLERNRASNRAFDVVIGSFIVTASSDVAVSMYQIGRGQAREIGFGAWWQDSPVLFSASKSAMTVAFAYGLKRVHKSRPKTAFVMGIVATTVEGLLVVRSARIAPPPR